MPPDGTSTDVDWRPYSLTAIALAAAVALNLWTGNRLWLFYSLIGTAGFLAVVGVVRARQV